MNQNVCFAYDKAVGKFDLLKKVEGGNTLSAERHYFPGNNTPLGFFSYYRFILGQREANKIICVKGGPGSGKSTFMKRVAEHFANMGESIDYLHCSADENSLDGVVIKERKIALIDGTSPHITDPITPGAVDKIVNLGEFWNEEGIAASKDEIIDLNEECSEWYKVAYNYLNAAKSLFRSLESIYENAVEYSELYRIAADIVAEEYSEYEISIRPGREKKSFATAVTANGIVGYCESLLRNMKKVYIINSPLGYANGSLMSIIKEGAIYRGFDVESFYCSMSPDEKIDHLIVPELGIAFTTVNEYHDIEPWEIFIDDEEGCDEDCEKCLAVPEIYLIDIGDYMDAVQIEKHAELAESLREEFDILLHRAIKALDRAKHTHMLVESYYIPNMNFTQVGRTAENIIEELMEK